MAAMQGEKALPYRLSIPRAERRHPWLGYLFDLYAAIDASVAEALALAGRASGCGPGCHGCCHQVIPATPLEVAGIRWYVREAMPPVILDALRNRPEPDVPPGTCRFLAGGGCAVYAVRPVACRRYMVLGRRCRPEEDAFRDRPGDVLRPSREALAAAYALTLPYYAALGDPVPPDAETFAFMAARTAPLASISAELLASG